MKPGPKPVPVEIRFSRYLPEGPEGNGCILWQGSTDRLGYGSIGTSGKRTVKAHRLSYELAKGPIPDGLVIDHLCRVPGCVNPEHLEAVTQGENVRRGVRPRPKTHCPHGHPYNEENTYVHPNGSNVCRACQREKYRNDSEFRQRRLEDASQRYARKKRAA